MGSLRSSSATLALIIILLVIVSGCSTTTTGGTKSQISVPAAATQNKNGVAENPAPLQPSKEKSATAQGNATEPALDNHSQPNVTGSAGKVNEINANDLKNILSKEKRPVIIDVSTPGEFREGHIHGSLLGDLRLLRSQPDQYLESLNIKKSDTIVLVCETGSKSYKVAEVMMRAGYQNVYNLKSGKIDWVRSGYELISGEQ